MSENQKENTSIRLDFSKVTIYNDFDNLASSSLEVVQFQAKVADDFI
jgi:hypothetical protein